MSKAGLFATLGSALDRLLANGHETPIDLREDGAELAVQMFETEGEKFCLSEDSYRTQKWTHADIPALEIARDAGHYGHHWAVHHDNVRLSVSRKLAKRLEAVLDARKVAREVASVEALAAAIVARGRPQP